MEELSRVCPVDPHFVNLLGILTQIFDVTENVSFAVLAYRIAKVRAQAHIRDSRFMVSPLLDWKAFEKDESFTIQDFITDRV